MLVEVTDNLWELVLAPHQMGLRDQTQDIRLAIRHLLLLKTLTRPNYFLHERESHICQAGFKLPLQPRRGLVIFNLAFPKCWYYRPGLPFLVYIVQGLDMLSMYVRHVFYQLHYTSSLFHFY